MLKASDLCFRFALCLGEYAVCDENKKKQNILPNKVTKTYFL